MALPHDGAIKTWAFILASLRYSRSSEQLVRRNASIRKAWDDPMRLAKARWTVCKHGHEFDDTNSYIDNHGHQICRVCNRIRRNKRYWALKRAQEQISPATIPPQSGGKLVGFGAIRP